MVSVAVPAGAHCPRCHIPFEADDESKTPMVLECGHLVCSTCSLQLTLDDSTSYCPACFDEKPFEPSDCGPTFRDYLKEKHYSPGVPRCRGCEAMGDTDVPADWVDPSSAAGYCASHASFVTRRGTVLLETRPFSSFVGNCPRHPRSEADRYCLTCDEKACASCAVFDHPEPAHVIVEVGVARDRLIADIVPVKRAVDEGHRGLATGKVAAERAIAKIATDRDRAIAEIHATRDSLISDIKGRAFVLEEEVNTIAQANTATLERQAACLQHSIDQLQLASAIGQAAIDSANAACLSRALRAIRVMRNLAVPFSRVAASDTVEFKSFPEERQLRDAIAHWGRVSQ
jgi:hypothetical protein